MNCPSCKGKLDYLNISQVQVYVCTNSCGGIWFNRLAILKLSECPKSAGQVLLLVGNNYGVRSFRDVEHICPQCETTLLYRHFFSKEHDLEVDQCAKCGGLWIDFSKKEIFMRSEDHKEKVCLRKWKQFEKILNKKFDILETKHPDLLDSRKQIFNAFRFISPMED